MTKMNNNKV